MPSDRGSYGAPDRARPDRANLRVRVVDPSLFTIPYDQALVRGLLAKGISTDLTGRPLRAGEAALDVPHVKAFYRIFDGAPKRLGAFGAALKALEHCYDGLRFALSKHPKNTVIHFQWLAFPLVDGLLISLLKLRARVVVTVHDTMPFNGTPTSRLQSFGVMRALRKADRTIVHTQTGKARLVAAELSGAAIDVIPHGPLGDGLDIVPRRQNDRWTLIAFGKIRPYKGLDVLVEALATLDASVTERLQVIVAGEAMMDLTEIKARISASGLDACITFREGFLNDTELAALFAEADGFVFPYKEIEASGVLYLVGGLGRWIIASKLGAFVDAIEDGVSGDLVPPEDPAALGRAIAQSVTARKEPTSAPHVATWDEIADRTLDVYHAALSTGAGQKAAANPSVPQFQDTK